MWRERASYLLHVILDDANKNNGDYDMSRMDAAPSIAGATSGGAFPIAPHDRYSQGTQS